MRKLFLPFQPNFPFIENTMESYDIYGFLCKVVERVNELQDTVESFNIDELEKMLEDFKAEIIDDIDSLVDNKLNTFEDQILANVDVRLDNYKDYYDTQYDILKEDLEGQIQAIEIGDIDVFNPTTGQIENINKVIEDIYNMTRDGITAGEFDELELTATDFDALEITATNFDLYSKTILTE